MKLGKEEKRFQGGSAMGKFSKYNRYHEQQEGANVNNVRNFGQPAYSLYTSAKVFSLHKIIDITNENNEPVYHSKSKVLSLHDHTDITDAAGRQVAHISSKFFSLHERHYVNMADGRNFELSNEFFHLIKDITNIEGLGWQLRGNIVGLNFELYDADGSVIAVTGQKMVSLHDKYSIDIYRPEFEKEIVAVIITLQHMMQDRRAAASSSGSSSSSS